MKLYRRCPSVLASLLISAVMSGCITSNYLGIALAPGAADPTIQQLAERARSGDKQAQLELGIAFEEGRGVPQSITHARLLYRLAASESGGPIWVYVPASDGGDIPRVMKIDREQKVGGLDEARRRLSVLDGGA